MSLAPLMSMTMREQSMELHNQKFAIYLPAVPPGYVTTVVKPLPENRRFPSGLTPADLMFWEDNKLWHYPYLLHSIGQYRVGQRPHTALDKANRRRSILIGDSGGYQIGKGTLAGLEHVKKGSMNAIKAMEAWRKERSARSWITEWLSQQCDYGMTIDMPLWAPSTSGANSPFHHCTSAQLIAMSVQNLRLIDEFSPSESKWLNVVQGGETYLDAIEWYRSVKWFRRGGWALAGSAGVAGGLVKMLITIMMMRDDKAFEPGQDWLHVLGVSTPFWAVVLSCIQDELRRENPSITVSFDSSSPALLGGRFEHVCLRPELTSDPMSWAVQTTRAPQRPSYAHADCQGAFPYPDSPLGALLRLNELNVQEGPWQPRQYDSLSNAMLINHNTWIYLDAFRRANSLVESQDWSRVPTEYVRGLELIRNVFACKDAIAACDMLEPDAKFLDGLAPMTM